MLFVSDIFDKTLKVIHTMDRDHAQQRTIQKIDDYLTNVVLLSDYFLCDLYADPSWLKNNVAIQEALFDYFSEAESEIIMSYLLFTLVSERVGGADASRPQAPVAVVIGTESLLSRKQILAQLRFNSPAYLFYIIINVDLAEDTLRALKYDFPGKATVLSASGLTKSLFINYVEANILSREAMRDVQTLSILKYCKPFLQEVYRNVLSEKQIADRLSMDKERKRNEINKLNNDKTTFEQLANIKTEVQKNIRELERGIRRKYVDLLLPNSGRFPLSVEIMIEKLQVLDTRNSLDNRFPKVHTSVPNTFIESVVRTIKVMLLEEFNKDKSLINEKLALMEEFITAGGVIITELPDPMKITESYVDFEKKYEGEMPKNNFQSYLMQIRQQTFFIFIILALLNPVIRLPMLLINDTALGIKITNWISYATGLVSLAFAIYFTIDLKKKIPLIKAEQLNRELEKVRRELRQDCNRIFIDISREWLNQLNSRLTENVERMMQQIDNAVARSGLERKKLLDELERDYNTIAQEVAEKSRLNTDSERLLVALIGEYSNNIIAFDNKVNSLMMRFRAGVK